MKLRDALRAATDKIAAVSDTPRLDAELLAAHALGVDRSTLLLSRLDEEAPSGLEGLVSRRLAEEPVAYITGTRDFWTLSLFVQPGVLIPRPDSETLIEAALDWFGDRAPESILDLGTGSGALLLATLSEFREARGLGVDQSSDVLNIAGENARHNGLSDRATFQQGNWCDGLSGTFDLILCNPPYISTEAKLPKTVVGYEPSTALFAGADGLADYRILAPQISRHLAAGGCAAVEIGFDQAESVGTLFRDQGLSVDVRKDLGGRDRCLLLTKSL